MPTREELADGFTIGEWEVLPSRWEIRCGDQVSKPERKVMETLLCLAIRNGEVVTKDELVDEVWGGRPTGDEPINRAIHQLRVQLGDRTRPYRYVNTQPKVGYRLIPEVKISQAETAPAIGSIAVIPFESIGGDPSDDYIASGLKEELVHTMHGMSGLLVKHGRIDYPDLEVTEISRMLSVESVLTGSVQREGDTLKVNYQIARGSDGVVIRSSSITGRLKSIFALQAELAEQIRQNLDPASGKILVSGNKPSNFEAYDNYLRGLYSLEHRGKPNKLEDAIEKFKRTIELDSTFGPAYLALAMAYVLLPDHRNASLKDSHDLAESTVNKGIEYDKSIRAPANAIFAVVHQWQRQWSRAEQEYIAATSAQIVDTNAFNWYSLMLACVGRLEDALEVALQGYHLDPSSALINGRVAIAYTWLDEREDATKFFERAESLDTDSAAYNLSHAVLLIRLGRLSEAESLVREATISGGGDIAWIEPVFMALEDPAHRAAALEAVDKSSRDGSIDLRVEAFARIKLDDVEGAWRVARKAGDPAATVVPDFLFLQELQPLRQHPGFLELMESLGIDRYWRETGGSVGFIG